MLLPLLNQSCTARVKTPMKQFINVKIPAGVKGFSANKKQERECRAPV